MDLPRIPIGPHTSRVRLQAAILIRCGRVTYVVIDPCTVTVNPRDTRQIALRVDARKLKWLSPSKRDQRKREISYSANISAGRRSPSWLTEPREASCREAILVRRRIS